MKNKKENILIIGAGLCGSLLALRLAQRGYKVDVYENRPDLRDKNISAGKSINLALSDRGFKALRLVGIEKEVRKICIPMYGRLIHNIEGDTFISNYSGRKGEYINSISRNHLNIILLNQAEKHKNVKIHFNKKCTSVNIENTVSYFKCYKTKEDFSVNSDLIFGTDGAGSILRKSYYSKKKFLFNCSQDYLTHGYKELEIPADNNGNHQISKNHLHIWSREKYMLIALPNLNGSFTVTLFLGHEEGIYNFKKLSSEKDIVTFFEKQFSDALKLIPNIAEQFTNNPTGMLGTIKCCPWHYQNKTLIMGDAAHTIVPFYGQGMNASFEDITVFDDILEQYKSDWKSIFKEYEKARKKDTDAIADLAIENYYEMRYYVSTPLFKQKSKIEMALEKAFPDEYFSKYSMVTFSENTPYSEAMKKGRAQNKALLNIISDDKITTPSDMTKAELKVILQKVREKTTKILLENKI